MLLSAQTALPRHGMWCYMLSFSRQCVNLEYRSLLITDGHCELTMVVVDAYIVGSLAAFSLAAGTGIALARVIWNQGISTYRRTSRTSIQVTQQAFMPL